MVAGGGHRHGGAAAERGEGKGEKRRRSLAHPRSTATTKKAAGAEEGGGAARVDGVDGVPAVRGLGEGVDGVDGGAAKPEEATPGRETVPASREDRPEVVSDRGERGRRRELDSGGETKLQEELGTRLNFSTAYHPHTDGQTERVNQILEDMLRACALDFGGALDKSLPYAEFSYNNSYQASLQMAPFEALYGRKCRTPLFWDQIGERQLFGTEVLIEAEEKVRTVRERLRIAQSRQKSYADNHRRELTFEAGDFVYLRVTPLLGVHRFQIKGKLAPRFVGPYKILERRG
uniref:Retrotransposon protein, putative, Ty3-gypsy subclass n=2 Tax=Oryza sativa subsp. japonica TaxID=39947 RepID=Q84ST9_ORYSJ|nr:retrotransposon protein, putative, Ty3-gypsy sub-class [Oryza sativa Japonica Group]ABF97946.1 retrotransposon protein, putative, Ty3-gypsy subclass [Oryza sativa Japonica Group]